ncbi:MAG TPA: CBS domain-containing protein [Gemmatimonadaceae bacterium]|jgi:CBS domain-containing protein
MKVQEVMTRNPLCVTPGDSIRDAAQLMKRHGIGIVPVVNEKRSNRLVGVVTDRDIAIRVIAEGLDGNARVSDVMSTDDIATCAADDEVQEAMETMATEQVRRIPIVDERGSLLGIVAQADIVRKGGDHARAELTVQRISEPGGKHLQ